MGSFLRRLAVPAAAICALLGYGLTTGGAVLGSPLANADSSLGTASAANAAAAAAKAATRGTWIQATPTSAKPAPGPTTPYFTDRNVVRLDWLELPENSGTGKRVVYSKGYQRIWMVSEDGSVFNTHRVSGRMNSPDYGVYKVYSKAPWTCSVLEGGVCMRFMVRFAWTPDTHYSIGMHEIPTMYGDPMQTVDQLGAPLSAGCVRQSTDDAILMYNWAEIGTPVYVVP